MRILAPPADRNPAGPRPLAGLGSKATESGGAAQRQAPDLFAIRVSARVAETASSIRASNSAGGTSSNRARTSSMVCSSARHLMPSSSRKLSRVGPRCLLSAIFDVLLGACRSGGMKVKPCLTVHLTRQYRYRHLHVAIEPVENRHQPVDGKALELGLADARKIGGGDAGDLLGRPHRQIVGR